METAETTDLAGQIAQIKPDEIQTLPSIEAVEGGSLRLMAEGFEIIDQESADTGAEWRLLCDEHIDRIKAKIGPAKKAAFAAHRAITALESEAIAPFLSAREIFDRKITRYTDEQKRLAREAEERRQAEERKKEQERRAREAEQKRKEAEAEAARVKAEAERHAEELRKQGAEEAARKAQEEGQRAAQKVVTSNQQEQQRIFEAPIVTSAAQISAPKVAGLDSRETYKARLTNLLMLVKAAAENPQAYLGYLQANETAANASARAMKENFNVPGFELERVSSNARSRSR